MGAHDHCFAPAETMDCAPFGALGPATRETHLEFLSRRALEESRLAGEASTARAAAAHRYLAAAYAAAIANEVAVARELEQLLLDLP